jgi:sec-independent protein translocase protein TatB
MFEIGFWELVLIGIVALVVLGPERLPGAARSLGMWAGRARSYVKHFSSELEREASLQELHQQTRDLQRELKDSVEPTASLSEDRKP